MASDGQELDQSQYPHLSSLEWSALYRLSTLVGLKSVSRLLTLGDAKSHLDAATSFLRYEASERESRTSGTKSVKIEVTKYAGTEQESLPRWFVELETAFFAQQIRDPQMQVAFAGL